MTSAMTSSAPERNLHPQFWKAKKNCPSNNGSHCQIRLVLASRKLSEKKSIINTRSDIKTNLASPK
jgi:hypothetical protein